MFFQCKVGGKTYELPKLTLGEARIMRQHFDLTDISEFNPADPFHLSGLLYLCLRRENPNAPHEQLLAEVDGLDIEEFEATTEEPDPTPADADAESGG